jgi:hypothetical protein
MGRGPVPMRRPKLSLLNDLVVKEHIWY